MGLTASLASAFEAVGVSAATAATAAEATVVGTQALGAIKGFQALTNKPSAPPTPAAMRMPDPMEQEKAKQQSIAEMMARRGRQSTIVTQPQSGTLGG